MTDIKRIAVLNAIEPPAIRESTARLKLVARRFGIDARSFCRSEDIIEYAPDFVLVSSCQDAKLTPFPTYGLLAPPAAQYLQTPRFTRNVLTYDASLTLSQEVARFVRDLAFGARKFSCPIAHFAATVQATEFEPHNGAAHLAYVGSNAQPERLIPVIESLLRHETLELRGPRGAWECVRRGAALAGPVPFDGASVLQIYRDAGVGLDLALADGAWQTPPATRLLEIIAASAVAITTRQPGLERLFGDALLYVEDNAPAHLAEQVCDHLEWVRGHPDAASERARAAHRIFRETFALDRLFPALLELHRRVVVEKGYRPDPDPEYERDLPSVTYIVRTGGGRSLKLLRRALDSLVAQQYPKLKALLVLFRELPELDELRAEYPALDLKAVDDFGGLRSTAICAGMRNVDTDLLGLLDDDDVLSPNHVRMLVKALQYHDRRNWRGTLNMAYSGSVEVGETQPRVEHPEYRDEHTLTRIERRCIEHYRLYEPGEMSRHQWYLINSFLVRRMLIDDELLDDPRIHTCEDLYVSLQIAQRTFLAFSGEVTMNHCYGDESSTVVDAHRHLADTLRGARRHWTRLFPLANVYNRPFVRTGGTAEDSAAIGDLEASVTPHLVVRPQERRRGGSIALGAPVDAARDISSLPVTLRPGYYTLSAGVTDLSNDGRGIPRFDIEVLKPDDAGASLAAAGFVIDDLERRGDLLCATLRFVISEEAESTAIQVRLTMPAGASAMVHQLLVSRRAEARMFQPST